MFLNSMLWLLLGARMLSVAKADSMPEQEYNFLWRLYNQTDGPHWHRNTNWNFTNATTHNPCMQSWYGVLAFSFGFGCQIFQLTLNRNNLTGFLPPKVENFSMLYQIDFANNNLSGPLPIFKNVPGLNLIEFSSNRLQGSIASDMILPLSSVSQLRTFALDTNSLTGSLPDWIYLAKNLRTLSLHDNHLDGTLKANISQMRALQSLDLSNNDFHGSLPLTIGKLTQLQSFRADNNYFTGTLNASMISASNIFSVQQNNLQGTFPNGYANSHLQELVLASNYFTGTISPNFCSYMKHGLIHLSLTDNLMDGTVPPCVLGKAPMIGLEIDYNLFHGELQFSNNTQESNVLIYLSFGYNRFSGTFPSIVLKYPILSAVSAPNNCFQGGLSDFDCVNISIGMQYLDFDGLYSSRHCHGKHHKATWRKQMDHFGGKFPTCLLFTDLAELSAAGNGFTGTLPENASVVYKHKVTFDPHKLYIDKLDLSNNYFSGTVPTYFLDHAFQSLDLSYNKFHGDINSLNGSYYSFVNPSANTGLNLQSNRFSGRLPSNKDFDQINTLSILEGNVFECSEDSIPSKDQYEDEYYCEATLLTDPSYGYIITFVFLFCVGLFALCWKERRTFSLFSPPPQEVVIPPNVQFFLTLLNQLLWFSLLVAGILLVIFLPIYLGFHLSGNMDYNKYENNYGWIVSSVYLRGQGAAILLFILFVALSLLGLVFFVPHSKSAYPPPALASSQFFATQKWANNFAQVVDFVALYVLLFGITATVSVGMNIFYVMLYNQRIPAPSHSLIGIQIAMALYNLFWNRYVLILARRTLKILSGPFFSSEMQSNFILLLLLMNTIIAPLIATFFQDESCFENLFFGTDEQLAVLGYGQCRWSSVSTVFKICNQKVAFPLPFLYYYTCGSKLLSVYLPVWIYYYLMLPFFTMIYTVCAVRWEASIIQHYYDSTLRTVLLLDGIYFPSEKIPRGQNQFLLLLIDRSEIVSLFVVDLCALVCYGVNYPILGLMIALHMIFEVGRWKYLIFRYLTPLSPENSPNRDANQYTGNKEHFHVEDPEEAVVAARKSSLDDENQLSVVSRDSHSEASVNMLLDQQPTSSVRIGENAEVKVLHGLPLKLNKALSTMETRSFAWNLLYCNVFFNMIIIFDIAGDEEGFERSIWVPIAIGGILFGLKSIEFIFSLFSPETVSEKKELEMTDSML